MREPKMQANAGRAAGGQGGFTLVETLVAVVVLVFGLMAVTNLLLVAASSNTVANQGTAAVNSATRAMEMIRATSFGSLQPGNLAWDPNDGGKACTDPTLAITEWHCQDDVPGVGRVHTHWWITATTDARLLHIRVRSEGVGALAGGRSRAEFTTFRSCTNADPTTGGCPVV
jgi:prepilin-type N-terminal cleavage/methylation domain-containing protein